MLSKKDCLDFLNLTEKEVNILMEHENLQFILAVKKCSCLLDSPEGILYMHSAFLDKFSKKIDSGDEVGAVEIYETYQNFSKKFPIPEYLSTR